MKRNKTEIKKKSPNKKNKTQPSNTNSPEKSSENESPEKLSKLVTPPKEKEKIIFEKKKVEKSMARTKSCFGRRNNFNEYRHLMEQLIAPSPGDLKWTFGLREYKNKGKNTSMRSSPRRNSKEANQQNFNKTVIGAPSFYEEDLEKFIKKQEKKKKRSVTAPDNVRDRDSERNLINFLMRTKFDHPMSIQKVNFATGLRFYPSKEPKENSKNAKGDIINTKKNKKEWDDHVIKKFPNYVHLEQQGKEKEKFIMRPYEKVWDQVDFLGKPLKRRKFVRCKSEAEVWIGEHISRPKFSENYNEKNYAKIENLLRRNKFMVNEINFISSFRTMKLNNPNKNADKQNNNNIKKLPIIKKNQKKL